ncbi:MAM and LDL-receptor class A domain-containing protein 1-like isoform X2 [Sitodiplosis mosellana]|uniref:MAM and LDL-receptor class A domain-containing protein 1-like isoform X2 n=1 Tax=Sitodiplosis mosellana TaxID=263140 RepID=UPI002444607E|nr:MAM and LDL-receptor class A domain-containing protein 1-like isoform X2 [Sitodiplosis mosellana]
MKTLFELILISNVLLALVIAVCEGSLFRGLRPPRRNPRPRAPSWSTCPVPKIKNGTVRLQRGGRMVAFSCSDGFEIHGAMSIICASGRWKQDIPICIKTGCPHPQRRSNGLVMLDEKKQKSMLFCQEGYVAAGSSISFCNGNTWDRELGECRLDVGHSKICDFESVSICGWTQDDGNDFHWVRKNGWNSFEKLEYGPKHDHTKGIPLEGHYMIAEATNSRTTQRSRIFSPIHNQTDSENACFRFFYHMYGHKVGRLRAIVKNINETMDEIADKPKNILFEKENSQGNQWNEAVFMIEPTKADFQIVFEATGSRGLISDIAIDDVSLMKDSECLKYLNPEITTTESDGVYDMQSCANRCLETNSVRGNSADTFHQDGHLIEKCDCHQNCLDTSTCCWDYVATCIESISQPPDSDTTISTFDDSSMGFTTIELEVTTPVRTIIKSTTQKPAVATTKSSSTTSTTERSTSSTSSTSTTSSTFTASTTLKTTIESTVTRAKQVVNTLKYHRNAIKNR